MQKQIFRFQKELSQSKILLTLCLMCVLLCRCFSCFFFGHFPNRLGFLSKGAGRAHLVVPLSFLFYVLYIYIGCSTACSCVYWILLIDASRTQTQTLIHNSPQQHTTAAFIPTSTQACSKRNLHNGKNSRQDFSDLYEFGGPVF